MPATTQAGAVTNGYRAQLVAMRDMVAVTVARQLQAVDLDVGPAALDAALASWLAGAATLTDTGSHQAGLLATAYLTQYLRAAESQPPAHLPRPLVAPSRASLQQASVGLLWQLGRGTGRQVALSTGLAYAVRGSRTAVMTSARETLRVAMTNTPHVVGWRRVTSARTCGRCAAQAGVLHRTDAPLHTHPSCRCTQEPVLSGLREAVVRQEPTVVAP